MQFDQRGDPFLRVVDGDADTIARLDIGAYEQQTEIALACDFDGDDECDLVDIDLLTAAIAAGTLNLQFDLIPDGELNLLDRDAWLAEAGNANLGSGRTYLLGDANLDGAVDGGDFIVWNANKFTSSNAWSHGDFNADGAVDGGDFLIWNSSKFQVADSLFAQCTPRTAEDEPEVKLLDFVFDQMFRI
jgi:hypothetical protein